MRVAFVAPGCVFDPGSGAAVSARTLLEMLAGEGFACMSCTTAVFDGPEEFPLRRVFNAQSAAPEHVGKTLLIRDGGVDHLIFRTSTSISGRLPPAEQQRFLREAVRHVSDFRPDVIVSYANGVYGALLFQQLRRIGCRLVLWWLNAGINQPELFELSDAVVCPSRAMVDLCSERFGVTAHLLRDPIARRNAADPAQTLAARDPASRGQGFVTFVNPAPPKGATLAFALARKARALRPDLTFLFVESRFKKSFWDASGAVSAELPNVWWVPNQPDMRRIYARTSVLLYPSFAFEASGRTIGEAQLGGIPVLASRRGGIPDQMEGGMLFDLPEELDGSSLAAPGDAVVGPWLELLGRLMDDEAFYREASRRAIEAAAPFRWERHRTEVAALFRDLAAA